MALLLVILFVVAPLIELAVIIQVADVVGGLNTIGLLVAVSLVGAWLAKREGLSVLRRIRSSLDRGELPSSEVADGGLILLAGALMIAPGFLSDALALLLLLPPTRALVRWPLLGYVSRRGAVVVATQASWRRGRTGRDDGVWDVQSWEDPPQAPVRGELGDIP